MHCIKAADDIKVVTLASIFDWHGPSPAIRPRLIMLCISGRQDTDEARREIEGLIERANGVPTAVLSDDNDLNKVMDLLVKGVRGYIPMDVSLEVAIAAMGVVRAGGTFLPASSLLGCKTRPSVAKPVEPEAPSYNGIFTNRQVAVVDALRRGKPNKIIAYELDMRESTVKVHVRNIMKRLNVKNRTEVAIVANRILGVGTP